MPSIIYDFPMYYKNWAVVVPLANEEDEFDRFISAIRFVIDELRPGKVYFIVDNASQDKTLELCEKVSSEDPRFVTVWAPENRNVVDAYLTGLRVAFEGGHDIIIEMDAGLSHDPRAIPMFLRVLNEGNECAFGSRFVNGGSMGDSPNSRKILSKAGTFLARVMLGTKLQDMTSGFQGFHREIVGELLKHDFKSIGHFYQTELRYILRRKRIYEVPIHYQAPSPRVNPASIKNAINTLLYFSAKRLTGQNISL